MRKILNKFNEVAAKKVWSFIPKEIKIGQHTLQPFPVNNFAFGRNYYISSAKNEFFVFWFFHFFLFIFKAMWSVG